MCHCSDRYEAVKKIELEFMCKNWAEIQDTDSFENAIKEAMNGGAPHASGVVLEILKTVAPKVGRMKSRARFWET